jgi:hypothetical protein
VGYDNEIIKVCRLQNGYVVEIYKPTPKEAKKLEKGSYIPYDSPWKEYALADEKEVVKFIGEQIGTLTRKPPGEEYDDAFGEATAKKG